MAWYSIFKSILFENIVPFREKFMINPFLKISILLGQNSWLDTLSSSWSFLKISILLGKNSWSILFENIDPFREKFMINPFLKINDPFRAKFMDWYSIFKLILFENIDPFREKFMVDPFWKYRSFCGKIHDRSFLKISIPLGKNSWSILFEKKIDPLWHATLQIDPF